MKTTGEAESSLERKVVGSFSTRTFAACSRCSTALIFIERGEGEWCNVLVLVFCAEEYFFLEPPQEQ